MIHLDPRDLETAVRKTTKHRDRHKPTQAISFRRLYRDGHTVPGAMGLAC